MDGGDYKLFLLMWEGVNDVDDFDVVVARWALELKGGTE